MSAPRLPGGVKFWAVVLGVVSLTVSALLDKFTGELGLYVSGMVCTFIGGNMLITRKALDTKGADSTHPNTGDA